MTEVKHLNVFVTQGFNLIGALGFEFGDDGSKGVTFEIGSWFNDQPKEFQVNLLLNVIDLMKSKIEDLEDENVRPN